MANQAAEMSELLAAANDPDKLLSAFAAQGLSADPSTWNGSQNGPWNLNQGGLETTFAQMTLATHQMKIKTLIDSLCAAVTETDPAEQTIKVNQIKADAINRLRLLNPLRHRRKL